jgi:hypothetical protein
MDLSKLNSVDACDNGAVCEILHPATGEPIGAKITLAGIDSQIYRKAQRALSNKRLKQLVGRGVVNRTPTVEEFEYETIEMLAKCTLAWEGIVWEGKELQCNFENAKMLYTKLIWLRDQVDAFINDRANFLQN